MADKVDAPAFHDRFVADEPAREGLVSLGATESLQWSRADVGSIAPDRNRAISSGCEK